MIADEKYLAELGRADNQADAIWQASDELLRAIRQVHKTATKDGVEVHRPGSTKEERSKAFHEAQEAMNEAIRAVQRLRGLALQAAKEREAVS